MLTLLPKFKNCTRPLFRPKTNHTCHQKPNLSRETFPLSTVYLLWHFTLCNVLHLVTFTFWNCYFICSYV
jgi:hypothetical protein